MLDRYETCLTKAMAIPASNHELGFFIMALFLGALILLPLVAMMSSELVKREKL
jgi:hypothetical protein